MENNRPKLWMPGAELYDTSQPSVNWQARGGAVGDIPVVGQVARAGGAVSDAFTSGGNIAYDMYQYYLRKTTSGPADPTFDQQTFINDHAIPQEQHWRFAGARNEAEATALLTEYQERLERQEVMAARGFGYSLLGGVIAGLVDIDAPLVFATGGLTAAARAGINSTRIGRIASGTAGGAAMGLGLGSANYQFDPTMEADEIAIAGIMGSVFGGAAGLISPSRVAEFRAEALNEVGENISEGRWSQGGDMPAYAAPFGSGEGRAPRAFDASSFSGEGPSVGARATASTQYTGPGLNSITHTPHLNRIADAVSWRQQHAADVDGWFDPNYRGNYMSQQMARAADTMGRVAQKIGIGNDFGRMFASDNPVFQQMAANLLEDASGRYRQTVTAATLQRGYMDRFGKHLSDFHAAERLYLQERGWNFWDTAFNKNAQNWEQDFYRQVQLELAARRAGRPSNATPSVQQAADAHARFYEEDVKIGKGQDGELAMRSYEAIDADPTYMQQRWSGSNFQRMLEDAARQGGTVGRNAMKQRLINAVDEQYAVNYANMDPTLRRKIASAVVDRAATTRTGIQRDLNQLLLGDASEPVMEALRRNGVSQKEIDSVLESLRSTREDRVRPGHTRQRMEVDFGAVSSDGIAMIDLLDNDLQTMMRRRASQTAGQAALARMGIRDKLDYEEMVSAGLAYDAARGQRIASSSGTGARDRLADLDDAIDTPTPVDKELTDAIWSYFSGGPMVGGISPAYARIKKVTSLSLMNQLGLTNIAEFGAIAGAVGWQQFTRHISSELRSQINKIDSPLMQDLKHMAFFVPEEIMFNPRFNHESEKLVASGDIGRLIDKNLNRLSEIQGVVSGMYKIREMQQRVALTSVTSKLFEGWRKGSDQFSDARLADLGFDANLIARMRNYIDNGTAQFDADGNLISLNLSRWAYEDVELYRNVMTRNVNQLVQKALAGESNMLFHRDGLMQLFWQFKSFPLLAQQKQFARNVRIADHAALMTFNQGLIFAGLAYTARQLINGQTDNINPERVARGALMYSNMAGWAPMWVDPIAAMLGIDDWNLSGYSGRGDTSVVSIPASFGVLDRLAQAAPSAVRFIGRQVGVTEYTNQDIRNLKTIPIIGQMYGMNYLWNTQMGRGSIPAPDTEETPTEETTPTSPLDGTPWAAI